MPQSICSVDGCETLSVCRGWCRRHYNQQYKGKALTETVTHTECQRCGSNITAGKGRAHCSQQCREQAKYEALRNNPDKWAAYLERTRKAYVKKTERPGYIHGNVKATTCSVPECGQAHYAKGMCRLHYRRTQPRTPDLIVEATCDGCGSAFTTPKRERRWARQFCSNLCRDYKAFGATKCLIPRDHISKWLGQSCNWHPPVALVEIQCAWCGSAFMMRRATSRFCTPTCLARFKKAARRGREHGSHGTYSWAEIVSLWLSFDRCCAYCDQPTELTAIQAEHVVPLSRHGANNITNLLPSCRQCNGDKRDLLLDEWAADRQRRNLPDVRTTWPASDARYMHLTSTIRMAA